MPFSEPNNLWHHIHNKKLPYQELDTPLLSGVVYLGVQKDGYAFPICTKEAEFPDK